jgi:hypothetical protein
MLRPVRGSGRPCTGGAARSPGGNRGHAFGAVGITLKPLAEALEEAFQHCRDMDASLNERLQALADAVRTLSPTFATAVDRLVGRLQQSGAGSPRRARAIRCRRSSCPTTPAD